MPMQITGLSDLQHKLRHLPGAVENVAIDEIQAAGERIRDRAKDLIPKDTGNTASTIKKRREKKGLNAKVTVGYPGHIIEFGSKSHTIQLRRRGSATALAGEGFGPVAGPVQHPGTPARPFMNPAAEAERAVFLPRLAKAIDRALEQIAAGQTPTSAVTPEPEEPKSRFSEYFAQLDEDMDFHRALAMGSP